MAYDRYDPRDERARWRGDRHPDRDHGPGDDRGFFERAGDEVASWFGDDEAERRRREDQRLGRSESRGRDPRRDDGDRFWRGRSDHDQGGYGQSWSAPASDPRDSRNEGFFGRSGSREPRLREDSSRSAHLAGDRGHDGDPHYSAWRQRQLDELDRDYADYRREHQARFEEEFGGWRQRRQQKRGLLRQIREHMDVVGSDDAPVGTVDRSAGDRLILTKSDGESGGVHHSLSCADIERVDGDRVILGCTADEARNRWRDESRGRALFEREDQGEMGDRVLDRSFSGTYR
jgi:hypothetical protein